MTLLGIRPDLIRMHKLIRLLDQGQKKYHYEHIFVHSGQHFDYELDEIFYRELKVRKPDINLNIGKTLKKRGKTGQVYQSALLFERVDELMKKLKPDAVMYLGDTNTVTSALIVSKNNIPVIHIEAGGRSYDWRMPEEKNRIIVDHLSDLLYSYLPRYKDILISEGIEEFRVKVIGNIIHDSINSFLPIADQSSILKKLGISKKEYILLTLHREENVSQKKEILKNKLKNISQFAKEKKLPVVFPIIPRVKMSLERFGLKHLLSEKSPFLQTKPMGYFDFLKLEKESRLTISDSGTVQEESLILGVPCVIARRSTERPETILAGATVLEGLEGEDTLYKKLEEGFNMKLEWDKNILNPQGGSPSKRVWKDLVERIKSGFFEKSRKFNFIKSNKFVREAYNKFK